MRIRFLGTGAADWRGPDERGEERRFSSILVDEAVPIDCTAAASGLLAGAPEAVFITHSHADHYDPAAIRATGASNIWVHESWLAQARSDGLPAKGLRYGVPVGVAALTVTPLPANHSTAKECEEPCCFLLEAGGRRFLYATDGAWLPRRTLLLLGDEPLDGVAFDATCGPDHEADWRVFEHNSLAMVRLMERSLRASGRLRPDAPVLLTHLARTLWPGQAEAERLAAPLIVAHDGLKIDI